MNSEYSFSVASLEIIIALSAAFIAGALLCYLLRLVGSCCRHPKVVAEQQITPVTRQVHLNQSQVGGDNTDGFQSSFPSPPVVDRTPLPEPTPPPAPRITVEGGAYEADIDTLLRRGSATDSGSIPLPTNNSGNSSFENRVRESLTSTTSQPAPPVIQPLEMPDDDHVDDLKRLEGIGPHIEGLLNQYGIKSYARLATMDRDRLRDILAAGGNEFRMHEPKSWPYQAELAAKQNWDRLREYQEFLIEGRTR